MGCRKTRRNDNFVDENGVTSQVKLYRLQSSDWTIPNSILLKDTILMTGFPHELTSDQLKLKLPERYQKSVEKV